MTGRGRSACGFRSGELLGEQRFNGSGNGFTLIEILVVTVILGLLAALVVPKILGRTDDARRTAAKVQMRNIEQALQMFKLDNGVYPSTEQGLEALVRKPTVGDLPTRWREGGYLAKVPADSWARPFVYVSSGADGKREYDLVSFGADGVPGGEGNNADIESWNLD
jgi:general secretion pathway protein G